MTPCFLLLVAAHCIADFLLQPDPLIERKREKRFLLLHGIIHAAVSWLAVQAWGIWQLPVYVFVVHTAIDTVKQRYDDTALAFVADQTAHLVSLFALAWWVSHFSSQAATTAPLVSRIVITVGGFVATVQGSAFLIGKFTRRLQEENDLELGGLRGGGKWIGQLERALIFVLVFLGQPAAIGFLVAAKSIFRFEEAKKQELAEYILVGTLLSFLLAITLASATLWALKQFPI
ncbi:MAG: hypothetical protein DRO01_06970 [Thermoproteota archaeon]|nr:MAG: hypothetical protein DRO01_06970 [Candidatus Korarchaeota archaeon]